MLGQISMTKEEALEIQARQIQQYARYRSGLAELVASLTTAEVLQPGVKYDILTINKHIPRGGEIEALCGLDFGGE